MTTGMLKMNKIFDLRTFHVIVIQTAKKNIIRFLKFDEVIFCGISMFSISWIATNTVLIVVFLISLFLKAHLKFSS